MRVLWLVSLIAAGAVATGASALGMAVASRPTEIPIKPPRKVEQQAGTRLAEFEAGRRVTAQSGCLACHRIATAGNRGPGENLTHVGSRLSRRQIEHALRHAREPMPSFKNLPPRKFKAIVTFLSLLR